ncbi:MAG: hypothetical protein WD844_07090 [Thermoleophilaceae bacterium]
MESPRALTSAIALAAILALAACGGDEEAQPAESGAAGDRGTQTAEDGQTGGRAGSGDSAEDGARSSSGEEQPPGSRDERTEEPGEEGSRPAGPGSQRDDDSERESPSGRDRRGSSGRGQGLFGSDVEVKPVEPGSNQCEVELGGSTATVPCDQAEKFFGG